jgi:hypothetical protein
MPTSVIWLPLAIFVGTSIVSWGNGYLTRKQMRQTELHRDDPSVPVEPPPHPVTRFCKNNSYVLVFGTLNLFSLVMAIFDKRPLTRFGVFNIALPTAGLLVVFVTDGLRRMMWMMGKTWDYLREDQTMFKNQLEIDKLHWERLSQLEKTLEQLAPSKSSEGPALVQAENNDITKLK